MTTVVAGASRATARAADAAKRKIHVAELWLRVSVTVGRPTRKADAAVMMLVPPPASEVRWHDTSVNYPAALALTLLVEAPIYSTVLVRTRLASWRRALACGIGVNLMTHPVVWWLTGSGSAMILTAAELGAWLVEAALLYLVLRRQPALLLALSLMANSASFLAGLLLS
jgi:hypothetical protein